MFYFGPPLQAAHFFVFFYHLCLLGELVENKLKDVVSNIIVDEKISSDKVITIISTIDSYLDWPLLFNEKLKENPAYNNIISSVTEFDELINTYPDCLGELE